jgi:hypothetical protein
MKEYRVEGVVRAETTRGGSRKRAERRAGKEACCLAQGREGTQAVRRAKTAMKENPDALRKGKWPYCT